MAFEYQVRNTPQFSDYGSPLSSQPHQYGSDNIDDSMQLEATSDLDSDIDEPLKYSGDESVEKEKFVLRGTRLAHLSSVADQLELSFAVASIIGADGTSYPPSVLNGDRLCITRFQGGETLGTIADVGLEQIKEFTAQTASNSDSDSVLPYKPLPEWFCLDVQNFPQRLTDSNISVANPINILRMAHEYNRNVIFLDPNGGAGQTVVWQKPELSCRCLSISDFYRTADIENCGAPIIIFMHKNHIYCFIANDHPTLDHKQQLITLLENGTAVAFSDEMPREITNQLYLADSSQENYVMRLVPTYRGVELKPFKVSDMLGDRSNYLLFLRALAQNMVQMSPDYDSVNARSKVIMRVENSSSEKTNLAKYINQLSETHPIFMSQYKVIKAYVSHEKERQHLTGVIKALSDIQAFYTTEADIDAKDAMFTLLSHINYTKELRSLSFKHAELHLFRTEMVNAETTAKNRTITTSEFARDNGIIERDSQIACRKAVDSKNLAKLDHSVIPEMYKKIFETASHDLADKRKHHLLTKKEYDEWFVPLKTKLEASCTKKDDDETLHENEISEGIIASLAQQTLLGDNYIKPPKSAALMSSWLQEQYSPFNVQSQAFQAMLLDNAAATFEILFVQSSECSNSISICAAKIRVRILKQTPTDYSAADLELFSFFMTTMYERTHPIELIGKKEREAFERLLPVLKKDILARLWPSEEKMTAELTATMKKLAIEVGVHEKISRIKQFILPKRKQAIVLARDYKKIIDQTKISINSCGEMQFKVPHAQREITVKTETLKCMIKREKPAHMALHEILTLPPSKFDSTWGGIRQQSHKRRFW